MKKVSLGIWPLSVLNVQPVNLSPTETALDFTQILEGKLCVYKTIPLHCSCTIQANQQGLLLVRQRLNSQQPFARIKDCTFEWDQKIIKKLKQKCMYGLTHHCSI